MSKPLPTDHPMVQAIAGQLAEANRRDYPDHSPRPVGPEALKVLAEIIGAAQPTPAQLLMAEIEATEQK